MLLAPPSVTRYTFNKFIINLIRLYVFNQARNFSSIPLNCNLSNVKIENNESNECTQSNGMLEDFVSSLDRIYTLVWSVIIIMHETHSFV
jgi:hypothetical protein